MMERITHSLTQGSPEWHQFRATHFGASEAAAAMGLSKYKSRSALLKEKATGLVPDVDAGTQRVFDKGHATEALARPLAEAIIGDTLYPVTVSCGDLSASCDGLTMDGTIAFEHKQYNADLFQLVMSNVCGAEHYPQCQQVLWVTGAEKLFFVCSDGTADRFAGMWIFPDKDTQDNILAAWKQFKIDLDAYKPAEVAPVAVGAPIRDLPAIRYQLNGLSLTSNLDEFKTAALTLVEDSKRELTTDQDFADTEARVKAFKTAEDKIELMAAQVLAEIEDVDKFTRDLREVGALLRQARLNSEKKVTARKDAIRGEIVQNARHRFEEHIAALDMRIGRQLMPVMAADFAGVIKGKRTIASMQDAVDTELARAKIAANEVADRITINLKYLELNAGEYTTLFPDVASIAVKAEDDFAALVKSRIAGHKEAEAKRAEAAAARIAAEQERAAANQLAAAAPATVTFTAPAATTTTAAPTPIKPAHDPEDVVNAVVKILHSFNKADQLAVLNFCIALETRNHKSARAA